MTKNELLEINMLIKVAAVGKIKDKALKSKVEEFERWISTFAKLEVTEVPDSSVEKEGSALEKLLENRNDFVIVLSEEGREFTSAQFADCLAAIDRRLLFVIGGPFGLTQKVKARADLLLSLSKMTLTHEMARMLLLEQIFRAHSINKKMPYHH